MADTSVKLSGTYDSIEAYNIMVEMQNMSADYEEIRTEAAAAASAATAAVTTAQTAANSASTYAGNAQTYAGNANTSAGEAAGYASDASTAANNAASSETNAHNSEVAAAASASSAAASEAVVAGALPLSGGTMTGGIKFSETGEIGYRATNHAASPTPLKQVIVSSTDIDHWGPPNSGAKIALHTYDNTGTNTDEDGAFSIIASNGTDSSELLGRPGGNLTWKGLSLTDGSLMIVRMYETSGGPSSGTYITAPTVSGYQFVCWVASASNGTVRMTYISDPNGSTARVWYEGNTFSSSNTIRCYALYVRKW